MDLGGTGGVWISDTTGTADAASDGAGGREIVSFDYPLVNVYITMDRFTIFNG